MGSKKMACDESPLNISRFDCSDRPEAITDLEMRAIEKHKSAIVTPGCGI